MPYNPETDSTQLIGKPYKRGLARLAKKQGRLLRPLMELLIKEACEKEGIRIK